MGDESRNPAWRSLYAQAHAQWRYNDQSDILLTLTGEQRSIIVSLLEYVSVVSCVSDAVLIPFHVSVVGAFGALCQSKSLSAGGRTADR